MKKPAVSIVIENDRGEVLLMLRESGAWPYPGWWYTPGCAGVEGETPQETIEREMYDELELKLTPALYKVFTWPEPDYEYDNHVFHVRLTIEPAQITLHEGEEVRFFTQDEISRMDLAFRDNEILQDFFATKHD